MPKIYAVDFDDTLAKSDYENYPVPGEPNLPLINKLIALRAAGNEVILWTSRVGAAVDTAINYCAKYGLTFDAVNSSSERSLQKHQDRRKIYADYYIDDKAITPGQFLTIEE